MILEEEGDVPSMVPSPDFHALAYYCMHSNFRVRYEHMSLHASHCMHMIRMYTTACISLHAHQQDFELNAKST